ncbi:TPA: hypothetical protein DCX66_04050 [Candidatus Nomurabacteria bacterium]|uniref:Uncharacterized protein n=1 Tax=Candidatus Nomurabacteria bacterium GW2011_GWE1_35_16 TaxID=1618761 RepID=A0A0G0BA35_9BACT|nr:MAG: hypothetical protein UR55_C0012G0022 [Candidatus Nomurabacteria bacterium GW2011_GWF1_34_20]KKP62801.1 MAG: hypothetical protein UR57_C0011G0020 [Candidatus Nomurabacteria bacterium GW2011_GWE2_34_25]KKP66199.1 MAG: hypothetical protein UR64_C0011G0021 [Candidatus Nomurabacteria bacterium GW2011_GWE1_35_16]HAE36244.1 hypothetical protein [Candidatus Nomurabacteria bacterium]HAX65611.1 hypothetical protein [Candidatus Nomurabacteria bacterium]
MKNLLKFTFVIVVISLFSITPAFAVAETSEQKAVAPVVLATVNIVNASIVSEKDNVFNISFSLSNREGLQTGVKYGVKLVKESTKGQFVVDEKIYDESLTLNPNTEVKKEVTYTAPASLSGSYTLMLTSQNINAFPFGSTSLGKVTLKATTSSIQILPETCSLKVVGEKSNATYSLGQGVDIKPEESLKLICEAVNPSKTSVTATPTYETRYRSSYGDIIPATGGDSTAITFKAGESKSVSVTLPKATAPQAYDVSFSLNTKDSKSNPVVAHYVLRGNSATVQSVSLDKDYYKGGEKAQVSFVYTPSADSSGIRFSASTAGAINSKVLVENGKGKSCAKEQTQALADLTSPKVDLTFPIRSKCLDPKITVTLTDDKGAVLDQKEFNVKTTTEPKSNSNLFYIIIVLALLVIIILYTYMKKKNVPPASPTNTSNPTDTSTPIAMIFFLLLIAAFGFVPAGKASADTVTLDSARWAVVNLDKTTYSYPKDSVRATGYISSSSSSRTVGTIEVSVPAASSVRNSIYSFAKDASSPSIETASGLPIPSTRGTYNATFYLSAYTGTTPATSTPATYGPCAYVLTRECNSQTISYYQHNNDGTYTTWTNNTSGLNDTNKYVKTADASSTPAVDNYVTSTYSKSFNVIVPKVTPVTTAVTVNADESVGVSWDTEDFSAVWCECRYGDDNKSCGTGTDRPQVGNNGSNQNSFKLIKPTTFTVTCTDTLPTTPPVYTYYKLSHCPTAINPSTSLYQTGPYLTNPYPSTGRVVVGAIGNGEYNYTVIDRRSASDPTSGSFGLPSIDQVSDSGGNSCSYGK